MGRELLDQKPLLIRRQLFPGGNLKRMEFGFQRGTGRMAADWISGK
jgi:hypothetical protein